MLEKLTVFEKKRQLSWECIHSVHGLRDPSRVYACVYVGMHACTCTYNHRYEDMLVFIASGHRCAYACKRAYVCVLAGIHVREDKLQCLGLKICVRNACARVRICVCAWGMYVYVYVPTACLYMCMCTVTVYLICDEYMCLHTGGDDVLIWYTMIGICLVTCKEICAIYHVLYTITYVSGWKSILQGFDTLY